MGFTVVNALVLLILLVTYIVQFKLKNSSTVVTTMCINIDLIYITAVIFAGFNTMWYMFLAVCVESATDEEWHRYQIFMAIDTVAQALSVVGTLYATAAQYTAAQQIGGCYDQNKNLFIEIFIIICFNACLVVIMGVSTFTLQI